MAIVGSTEVVGDSDGCDEGEEKGGTVGHTEGEAIVLNTTAPTKE
jgi:hypothetical protein